MLKIYFVIPKQFENCSENFDWQVLFKEESIYRLQDVVGKLKIIGMNLPYIFIQHFKTRDQVFSNQ